MEKVNLTNKMLKQVLDHLTPTKWKCQCGQVNDMRAENCPVCGVKRDFMLKKTPQD
jgi:rubrerythrin